MIDNVVPVILRGKDVTTAATFPVNNPATGKVIHECSAAGVQEANEAVAAAAAAFPAWKKMVYRERRNLFLKAAEVMERRKEELQRYVVEETGATEEWSAFEMAAALEVIRDIAGRISSVEGSIPSTNDEGLSALTVKEPFGVVLAIAPWNAPCVLSVRSIAFPLAAGNTVVLKGSEQSPRSIWAVGSVFLEAGFPPGVLSVVYHAPAAASEVTSALIKHKEVKKVNFTGSTAVGRIIGRLCGENLKPVVLELGGKAPAIIWEDANLDLAAQKCALGAFLHSGQICMSTERIIVHKNIKDKFEVALKGEVDAMFPGEMTLINTAGVAKNKKLLSDAMSKGAKIVSGDPEQKANGDGTKMSPVVVSSVTPQMDMYMTESFGPTVSLLEVETEEEALRIANDTEYGLSSSVFTQDLGRGLRLAKEIETGAVHINGMTVHDEPTLPHGGAKASGFGRFNSAGGLEEWVRTKNITFRN